MRSRNEIPKEDKSSYEITSDGRVKVNITKLVESPEVQDFYKALRSSRVAAKKLPVKK
jgi:hypothetical protein